MGLSTRGVKNQQNGGIGDGDETPLDEAAAHSFRSMQWTDLAFATKELRRRMSARTRADASSLHRVSW